jgi:pantetheine-phosphate adenylyltransferase
VSIGVTTDRFLDHHPKPGARKIQTYATRRRALGRWLSTHYARRRWSLVALADTFGGSVEDGVDVLVVSADTVAGARAVNAERRRRGRRPVPVVVVPLVLADDLRPVSSRRIRMGEIDRSGRRRSRIEVGLAVDLPADSGPAARGIRGAFPHARVRNTRRFPSLGPPGFERVRRAAHAATIGRELGVAVARAARGKRQVVVRSATVELEPLILPWQSPSAFSAALERFLRRSAAAKPFSHGRN